MDNDDQNNDDVSKALQDSLLQNKSSALPGCMIRKVRFMQGLGIIEEVSVSCCAETGADVADLMHWLIEQEARLQLSPNHQKKNNDSGIG